MALSLAINTHFIVKRALRAWLLAITFGFLDAATIASLADPSFTVVLAKRHYEGDLNSVGAEISMLADSPGESHRKG